LPNCHDADAEFREATKGNKFAELLFLAMNVEPGAKLHALLKFDDKGKVIAHNFRNDAVFQTDYLNDKSDVKPIKEIRRELAHQIYGFVMGR
jgi:hypothetical protein